MYTYDFNVFDEKKIKYIFNIDDKGFRNLIFKFGNLHVKTSQIKGIDNDHNSYYIVIFIHLYPDVCYFSSSFVVYREMHPSTKGSETRSGRKTGNVQRLELERLRDRIQNGCHSGENVDQRRDLYATTKLV